MFVLVGKSKILICLEDGMLWRIEIDCHFDSGLALCFEGATHMAVQPLEQDCKRIHFVVACIGPLGQYPLWVKMGEACS